MNGVSAIELKSRHKEIIEIVKVDQPVTSEQIAAKLNVTRSALRSDLNVLTMAGILEAKPKVGYYYIEKQERERISEYLKKVKVADIKSRAVAIDEKVSVYDAIVQMFLEDVGSIFILNDGFLSGVVSRKDLLKTSIGGTDINQMPVGMIMTRMPNVVLTYPAEPIYGAAKKIIDHQIDALPIVEEVINKSVTYYKVVGRLSKTNITRLFVEISER
jgi:CBS domain-containing protein